MKNVLVTGGCGFIGSEVVKLLIAKDYDVTVVDDLSKPESSHKEGYKFVRADLTDKSAMKGLFDDADLCVHLAAKIGGIGYFHKYPATILSENNKIHSNVFEAAKDSNIKKILYISSSMVFERAKVYPSKEEHAKTIPVPITHYGCSKLIGEWYCTAFKEEHGLNYSIVRPFNAYGINEMPGDDIGYAHVIPDLVKKMLNGQYPLEILGEGNQTRCYTHINDIAKGIMTVLEHPAAMNEDFNISNDQEMTVLELAKKIWTACEMKKPFQVKHIPSFKHDVQRRVPDVSKAKEILGWQAEVKIEQGLPEVVGWLRNRLQE